MSLDEFPALGPDDIRAVPVLLSRFVRVQSDANLSAANDRKRTTEALGNIADCIADLSKQSIKVSAAIAGLSTRIEHVESQVAGLSASLRDTASILDSRVGVLEIKCAGLVLQVDSIHAQRKVLDTALPPAIVPSGLIAYVIVFGLCFGAVAMFVFVQWLVHLASAS